MLPENEHQFATKEVRIVPYDPQWRTEFTKIKAMVERYAGEYFVAIEHVGSTSVEGLGAKPIIDLDAVLRDPDDDTSLIREITAATYPPLKADGVVSKGMIPKIENALKAVEKGVRSVTIRSSENLSTGIGTVIRNS